jgi:hypothetical protein
MSTTNNVRVTVWRDIRANWSQVYPGTPEGYGRAYQRARQLVKKFGGDVEVFDSRWPDAGSQYDTAIPVGRAPTVLLSVAYVP